MSGSAREPAGYCASLVEIGRFVVCRWEFCPWSLRDVELSSGVVGQSCQSVCASALAFSGFG